MIRISSRPADVVLARQPLQPPHRLDVNALEARPLLLACPQHRQRLLPLVAAGQKALGALPVEFPEQRPPLGHEAVELGRFAQQVVQRAILSHGPAPVYKTSGSTGLNANDPRGAARCSQARHCRSQ